MSLFSQQIRARVAQPVANPTQHAGRATAALAWRAPDYRYVLTARGLPMGRYYGDIERRHCYQIQVGIEIKQVWRVY